MDPVLGTLEYINRDGGWWQGVATIAGSLVRMDVQQDANPSQDTLNTAANFLQWVQKNESTVRSFIGPRLAAGDFDSNMTLDSSATPGLGTLPELGNLRPCMIVLWSDHAELRYDCGALQAGNLLGAHTVEVNIGAGMTPDRVFLYSDDLAGMAGRLLERKLPADAADFADTIGDQFIAKLAEWGNVKLDAELQTLLARAIEDVEGRLNGGSPECLSYMSSVKALLLEIAKTAKDPRPIIDHLMVSVRARHPAGKRLPFKQKLLFEASDRAFFDGAGSFPTISLINLGVENLPKTADPAGAFAKAIQERLKEAAQWLAKQSPAVFQTLRDAGFVTDVFIYVRARVESEGVDLDLPLEFLVECGRLGLAISMCTMKVE